jgi:serine protease inhibitor
MKKVNGFDGLLACVLTLAQYSCSQSTTTSLAAANSDSDQTTLAASTIQKLNLELLKSAEADRDGNKFVSPLSLQIFLSILAEATNGSTKSEILSAMGLNENQLDPLMSSERDLFRGIARSVQSANSHTTREGEPIKNFGLSLNNAIFKANHITLTDEFTQRMKQSFRPFVKDVVFSGPEANAAQEANAWGEKVTNGLIKEFINADALNMASVLFANAAYFEARWQNKFTEVDEEEYKINFKSADGSEAKVATMLNTGVSRLNRPGQFDAVALPYDGISDESASEGNIFSEVPSDYNFSSVFILPPRGQSVSDFLKKQTPDSLAQIFWDTTATKQSFSGVIYLPKLKFSWESELSEILDQLGINSIFSSSADFSRMTTSEKLQMKFVKQTTVIEMDELGTKAAAITSGGAVAAGPTPPPEFTIKFDRPYLFAIVHPETKTILFSGVVNKPVIQD